MNKNKNLVTINLTKDVKNAIRKTKLERGIKEKYIIEKSILSFCNEYKNRNMPKISGEAIHAKCVQRISNSVYSLIWLIADENYIPVVKLIDFSIREYLKKYEEIK